MHTVKTLLIVCFVTGLIGAVVCGRGQIHDFKLFKQSKIRLSQKTIIKLDLGFLGMQKLYRQAELPKKGSKYHPLTKEQKQSNKRLASERVLVEHINRECKIFKICKERYRGKHKNYEKTWKLVASIVNLKRSTRHLKFASP
jgi:DDE superfamily endonuclease